MGGPRQDGPRPAGPRHDGPRPGAKPAAHGGAPRGEFQPRPPRDAAPQRLSEPGRFSEPGHRLAAPGRHREPDGPRASVDAPKGTVWLYGHHAVAAALANPNRRLRRLLLTDEAEAAISKQLPPPWAVSPERVDRGRLDTLLGRDIVHQGAALLADPLAPPSLQSVLEKPGVIIVLDQVTDPRNVGAIMRSAAAFGAAAVITQDRNAPEETGGLAKAASGALEKMPLLRAVNIARTIIALKAANVWCIGLDAAGKALSGPAFADRRVALVLGAEGEGLRRLTRETCDEIAGLTIKGAVESLNVSAAASVALYELSRR
ncbi:MAG: methyltransferase [Rhodopila sp.]|jgi:23S rRNA (guanosine2251-2'-O)-methyltransferase|nr:methyltransferase [Rhodopila sp.]